MAAPRTTNSTASVPRAGARERLLDAAIDVIRERGFSATTVDDLCAAAGVTKGAFFHHFESKEALGVAAAEHWSAVTGAMFAAAGYHEGEDPLDRVLGYLDLRAALVSDDPAQFSCVAGTMAQEVFATRPAIRAACGSSIAGHAGTLEADLAGALERYRPEVEPGVDVDVEARRLATHTQVVLQGAFVVAKATDDPRVVLDSIEHLRRYLLLLFHQPSEEGTPP